MTALHKPGYPVYPYLDSLSDVKVKSLLQYKHDNYDTLYEKYKGKYCWMYDGGIEFEANTFEQAYELAKERKNRTGFITFFGEQEPIRIR